MSAEVWPLVSIGMPVHNEERHIESAVCSLLAQTYTNFELLIADNASSDSTEEVCKRLAADTRVHYLRNERNVGAAENFANVQQLGTGKYFMWASGHDLWDSDLLQVCVNALEEHPGAALAVGACEWIGPDGGPSPRQSGGTDTRGMSSVERFFTVIWGNMHPVLGVIRADFLRSSTRVRSCMGADLLLLSELALKGDFLYVHRTKWYRRDVRPLESYEQMLRRHRSPQYGLVRGHAGRQFPLLTLAWNLSRVLWRAPLALRVRLLAFIGLLGSFPARYVGARLRRA